LTLSFTMLSKRSIFFFIKTRILKTQFIYISIFKF